MATYLTSDPPPYAAVEGTLQHHNNTPEADRHVILLIKDGHDYYGTGMFLRIKYTDTLKNALDTFKARSCRACRTHSLIRLKVKDTGKTVKDRSTPKDPGFLHDTTMEIRAWSNSRDLRCKACERQGYPKTAGVEVPGAQTLKRASHKETISLHIKDITGYETHIKTVTTAPLRYLMEECATMTRRELRTLRFTLDGERLEPHETAKKHGLESDDQIQVLIEVVGG